MSPIRTKKFISDQFLLHSRQAEILFHDFADQMPIIDYHNHLSPKQIAQNLPLNNMTDAWLSEDHYKWRAMRANGIDEKYITGKSSKEEKFLKWAETVPYTIRNPLFHWTHLELMRYFDIDEILQPTNALEIYQQSNKVLSNKTPNDLLKKMNIEVVCTTDDPIHDLSFHQQIKKAKGFTKVYPTFRADAVCLITSDTFIDYMNQLEMVSGLAVDSLDHLLEALQQRVDYFDKHGCKLADYGLQRIYSSSFSKKNTEKIFKKRLSGAKVSSEEAGEFASCILYELARMYHKKGWVQQFHLGALRNNNSRLQSVLGADAGCDSIGDIQQASAMSRYFDRLDAKQSLPKTVVYNLNPSQNEVFATMMGNFNQRGVPGKMQWGSAWWFLDQYDGMKNQLKTLSNVGLLSRFIGMLTDSRSFLSFPRHEYFRRILCNLLAEDINKGHIPNDLNHIGKMVQDICYNNAINYFEFNET